MAYFDSSGGLHNTEEEARRANSNNASGVDQAAEAAGGAGFAIIIWAFLGLALLIFLINNIKYFIIMGILVAGFKVVRKVTKYRPWFVRIPSAVGVIVLIIVAVLWCFFDMSYKTIPPITSVATIKSSEQVREIKFLKNIKKNKYIASLEEGQTIQVLGSTTKGDLFKVKTDDGVTGYIWSGSVVEKEAITAYMPKFWSRVNSMYLKSTPYVNLPGKYKTDGEDFELTFIGVRIFPVGLEAKLVKNKEPVILNGVPYNYTWAIQIDKSWATPGKDEPEDSWQNESRKRNLPIFEQHVGDYVITSQTSFVDPKGRTWRLQEEKK